MVAFRNRCDVPLFCWGRTVTEVNCRHFTREVGRCVVYLKLAKGYFEKLGFSMSTLIGSKSRLVKKITGGIPLISKFNFVSLPSDENFSYITLRLSEKTIFRCSLKNEAAG